MIIRVADYIMQQLYFHGVKHLFMVTGRGALFLTDAAAKHENLTCICTHHEQAAAYACVAYSQYNDTLGACLVSTGCAGTNTFTGVLNAWQDGIPCVLHFWAKYTTRNIATFRSSIANLRAARSGSHSNGIPHDKVRYDDYQSRGYRL